MTTCGACDQPATHGWQRQATQTELDTARLDPNNPSVQEHETIALIPVYACAEHAIDEDLATQIHDATCTAPTADRWFDGDRRPGCDCSVSNP